MSMPNEVLNTRSISRDLFSASIGSVACCYTVRKLTHECRGCRRCSSCSIVLVFEGQPFDTVKVRMQTRPDEFSGVVSSTLKIVRAEGVAALWKGAVPTAGGMVLENCMAFGINEALKRAFPDDPAEFNQDGPPSLLKPFLMGGITGCCSATVLLPSEIIKAKTQVEIGNTSSQEILRTMIKRQGIRSLFVGFDAQLMRDGPFYACFFGGYELWCYFFRTYTPNMPDELNYFLSGGLAGMCGWAMAMVSPYGGERKARRWQNSLVMSFEP